MDNSQTQPKYQMLAKCYINAIKQDVFSAFVSSINKEDANFQSVKKTKDMLLPKTVFFNLTDAELSAEIPALKNYGNEKNVVEFLTEIYHREKKGESYFLTDEICISKFIGLLADGLFKVDRTDGKMAAIKIRKFDGKLAKYESQNMFYYLLMFYHELRHESQYGMLYRLFKGAKLSPCDKIKALLMITQEFSAEYLDSFVIKEKCNQSLKSYSKYSDLFREIDYYNIYSEYDAESTALTKIFKYFRDGTFNRSEDIERYKNYCENFLFNSNPVQVKKQVIKSFKNSSMLIRESGFGVILSGITRNDLERFLNDIDEKYRQVEEINRYVNVLINQQKINYLQTNNSMIK